VGAVLPVVLDVGYGVASFGGYLFWIYQKLPDDVEIWDGQLPVCLNLPFIFCLHSCIAC